MNFYMLGTQHVKCPARLQQVASKDREMDTQRFTTHGEKVELVIVLGSCPIVITGAWKLPVFCVYSFIPLTTFFTLTPFFPSPQENI